MLSPVNKSCAISWRRRTELPVLTRPQFVRLGSTNTVAVRDAAHEVLCSDARSMTGRFLLDEDVLRDAGVRDFDAYQYAPGETLTPDLFVAGR